MAMYLDKSGVETQLFQNDLFGQLGEYLFKDAFFLQATEITLNAVPLTEGGVQRKSIQGRPIFFFINNSSSFDHSSSVSSYVILFHPKYILSLFVHTP